MAATTHPIAGRREEPMATYVLLSTLTENGALTVSHNPDRIREVNGEVEKMGFRILAQYALLGPYDFITIIEAANNAAVARLSASIASRGSVRIMTLPAIPVDEFIAGMKK